MDIQSLSRVKLVLAHLPWKILIVLFVLSLALVDGVAAQSSSNASPFVGHWQAIDVDGSDIRLAIGGSPRGPFQITWTESYITFCNGEAGIVRGTGVLNESDENQLEADLVVECLANGASREIHLTFRYYTSTGALSTVYYNGLMVLFNRPGSPQNAPASVRLMTNYQEDWASGFYEEGHTVWMAVTESDGVSVKAAAEMVTGPQPGWDGGEIGFASQPGDWQPEQPDIVPGDWVFVWVDNGASAQMQVGEISAWVDLENDKVLGTVSASWYSDEVYIYCMVWNVADARNDMIMADGSDGFICSWSGAYDIRPGDVAEVQYYGPDGHAVDYYIFIPNPHFSAFPEWEYLEGYEWPDEALVSISVEGKEICSTSATAGYPEWDPNNTFLAVNFPEGCDLAAGDVVTASDGVTTRSHTVRHLAISSVDEAADMVAGTSDPGEMIYVWPHETGQQMEAAVDEKGNWLADFSGIYDIYPGSGGRSEIRDDQGNATTVDWYAPNTRFTVFPEWNYLEGYEWPDGAVVSISVAGKEVCSTSATAGFPEWDPSNTFFAVNFPEGCAIEVGDLITLSVESLSLAHQVQELAISEVNLELDTVAGTAVFDPEQYILHTWIHGVDESYMQLSAEGGTWLADFSLLGFDLQSGMCGRAEIVDGQSNATAEDWCLPLPSFAAYMPSTIEGYDWSIGHTITLDVNDGEYSSQAVSEPRPGFPEGETRVLFELWKDGFALESGAHVVMSDIEANIIKELWVADLQVTAIDVAAGTVSGVYEPAYPDFWVRVNEQEPLEIQFVDNTWVATFADLIPGTWGFVAQDDDDHDGTVWDFQVPYE